MGWAYDMSISTKIMNNEIISNAYIYMIISVFQQLKKKSIGMSWGGTYF